MTDTEAALKLRARLAAIELLLADLYVKVHSRLGATPQDRKVVFDRYRENLKTLAFEDVDPVQSDQYAAELEEAVSALLELIEDAGKAE